MYGIPEIIYTMVLLIISIIPTYIGWFIIRTTMDYVSYRKHNRKATS